MHVVKVKVNPSHPDQTRPDLDSVRKMLQGANRGHLTAAATHTHTPQCSAGAYMYVHCTTVKNIIAASLGAVKRRDTCGQLYGDQGNSKYLLWLHTMILWSSHLPLYIHVGKQLPPVKQASELGVACVIASLQTNQDTLSTTPV